MARKMLQDHPGTKTTSSDGHLYCPWNDHGIVCGKRGSISHGMTGTSQLYCPEHFWAMEGRPIEPDNRHSGPGPAPCNHPGCTSNGVAGKNPFYCMDHYGLGSEKRRARGREPGQDDEERSV